MVVYLEILCWCYDWFLFWVDGFWELGWLIFECWIWKGERYDVREIEEWGEWIDMVKGGGNYVVFGRMYVEIMFFFFSFVFGLLLSLFIRSLLDGCMIGLLFVMVVVVLLDILRFILIWIRLRLCFVVIVVFFL